MPLSPPPPLPRKNGLASGGGWCSFVPTDPAVALGVCDFVPIHSVASIYMCIVHVYNAFRLLQQYFSQGHTARTQVDGTHTHVCFRSYIFTHFASLFFLQRCHTVTLAMREGLVSGSSFLPSECVLSPTRLLFVFAFHRAQVGTSDAD